MRKTSRAPLRLATETLRHLRSDEMTLVEGAGDTNNASCKTKISCAATCLSGTCSTYSGMNC